jgi:hypothetical protein
MFDPHPPFYPPLPNFNRSEIDFAAIETFLDDSTMTADDEDYIQLLEDGVEVDKAILEEVKTTYREAVEYTGTQLLGLMRHLDQQDILDDALIIITGDHGYEFGERGFTGAKSLYDANIRQGMIVKPPESADWTVPNRCDTIDILPTIAKEIGADTPDHCQGQPWQFKEDDSSEPRITERIRYKHYNVAVENNGIKAIYTYESNPPKRPTDEQLSSGPIHSEYYRLSDVRSGSFVNCGDELTKEARERMLEIATEFASRNPLSRRVDEEFSRPSQETEMQLRHLGYR